MPIMPDLRKAINHGTNYLFGKKPGTPQAAAMPPAGDLNPRPTSPTPNESIVLRPSQAIQTNEPNAPTGPGPAAGTDFSSLDQNVAFREQVQPVQNPQGISVVSTTDWFGPLQPLRAAAPLGTEPRKFEYVLGQNIIFEPRAQEAISYRVLRAMAEATDLLRMVIETMKNEAKRMKFDVNAPAKTGETRGQRKKREEADPIVQEIKELFSHPDGLHPWETFVGEVWEDMLTIDAPAILVRRTEDGRKVKQLVPADGSRFTRYITTSGLTPELDSRCDHPAHQLLGRQQSKKIQVCPCAAYAQYLYGVNAVNLTTRDLVYMPYNMRTHKLYGYSIVEQIMVAINLYLRREMSLLSYYTEGNIPEMIGFLPNSVTTDQVKEFEEWFNSVNRGDTAFMRRIRFVPNPSPTGDPKFVELKQHMFSDNGIDEMLIRFIAYAVGVSPMQLVRMHARSAGSEMADESQITALEPYAKWFASVMTHIIQVQMGYKGYSLVPRQFREADLLKQRQADQLMAKSGGLTLNEWRDSEGYEPYSSSEHPDADKPIIFTPQGYVVVGNGGVQAGQAMNGNGDRRAKPNTRANPNNQGDSGHKPTESPPFGKADFPMRGSASPAPHEPESRMREAILKIFGLQRRALEKAVRSSHQEEGPAFHRVIGDKGSRRSGVDSHGQGYGDSVPRGVPPGAQFGRTEGTGTTGASPSHLLQSGLKAEEPTDAEREPERLWLAIAAYYSLLPDEVYPAIQQAAVDAAIEAASESGVGPQEAITSFGPADAYAKSRAAEMVGMRRNAETGALEPNPDAQWVISDTTRENIREAVEKALSGELKDEAGNPLGLTEAIRKQLLDTPSGPFSDYRARLIAQTEVANARSISKYETWKRVGVNSTTWRTMEDDKVCFRCASNDRVTRKVGDKFPSGAERVPQHPGCRCYLIPHIESVNKSENNSLSKALGIPKTWRAYFMRHGETEANEKGTARGWGDWGLTPAGREQARNAGEFLVGHGITRIISSDLHRARQTAAIVSKILKVPVEFSKKIRSLNVGEFTGENKRETRDRFMPYIRDAHKKIPGGESIAGFIKRVVKFAIKTLAAEPDEKILFIFHSSDLGALSVAFNHASLRSLAHDEVVEPGGIAELGDGLVVPIFRPAPQGIGELE